LQGECVLRKTITLEVEVTVDESVEQHAIQVAREHYRKMGRSRAPLDIAQQLQNITGEEK
jgi:hypothetical protein